jgi:bla regulator protein blaR1
MLTFFADSFVLALGWTLLHSLWQGAAIALLVALLHPILTTPQARYRLALGGLLAILGVAVGTFFYLYDPAAPADALTRITLTDTTYFSFQNIENQTHTTWIERAGWWFEAHHQWVVAAWLVGFSMLLARLLGGLWYLHRIEQTAQPVGEALHLTLQRLAGAMRLRRPIALLQTTRLGTPATFGWLRPVVLLPIGLLNHLSPAEVEAVLAHELAHLARRDWPVQMLQAFVEAIFHFHPAVWWLSSVVRREREKCCDLLALRHLHQPRVAYARALVQVQAFSLQNRATPQPQLALYATGNAPNRRNSPFFERIQSILLQSPQQKSLLMQRSLAAAILLAALSFWGLRAHTPDFTGTLSAAASEWFFGFENAEPGTDTLPPAAGQRRVIVNQDIRMVQRVEDEVDGKKLKFTAVNGDITELEIDGQKIAAADFGKHKSLTDKVLADMPAPPPPPAAPTPAGMPAPPAPPAPPGILLQNSRDGQGNQTLVLSGSDGQNINVTIRDGKVFVDGEEVPAGGLHSLDQLAPNHLLFLEQEFEWEGADAAEQVRHIRVVPEVRIFGDGQQRRTIVVNTPEVEERLAEMEIEIAQQHAEADEQRARAMQQLMELEGERRQLLLETHDIRGMATGPDQHVFAFDFPAAGGSEAFSRALLAELKRDYLVTNPNDYEVELTGKKLKVNGKKQPANLHRKYLDLYERYHGEPLSEKGVFEIEVKR